MGYFVDEEEQSYRRFFAPLAGGSVVFLIGLILLLFGRGYGSDGTNYDLFVFFGALFLSAGVIAICGALYLQLKILFNGVKRIDQPPLAGYIPAQSAAGQIMRNTQIFSSAPPSTYDGGQKAQQMQPPPHQFSSAAAAYTGGSMDYLKQSQGSLARPQQMPSYQQHPPSYDNTGGIIDDRPPSQSTSSIGAPAPMQRSRPQPPVPPAAPVRSQPQRDPHYMSQATEI